MKISKRFFGFVAAAMLAVNALAQTMTFTYASGITATASELEDGSWLMQLPAGTDLNNAITGVKVNGTAIDAASVVPNPTTTFITDGEIETFVYEGKAYSFRFVAGEYFTVVMFSDPHVAQDNYQGTSVENMQDFVSEILKLGKDGGKSVTFTNAPAGYIPTTDLAICLGDMDQDSEKSGRNFKNAMSGFNDAGVPYVTLAGNHDLVPDHWHDSGNSPALNASGRYANTVALDLIKEQYDKAADFGGFTVETITDTKLSNVVHPGHFTFMYKGVRFYCANNYWFQKPYHNTYRTYYAADGTIDALNSYVENHKDEASVWVSHFPFYSEANETNDAYERWWLDQNNTPHAVCIMPTDAANSKYYNGGTNVAYTTQEGHDLVEKKQKALADIIVKSKNPRHFSGHSHRDDGADVTAKNGTTFRDHTIQPAFYRWAFVVLCKGGVGAIEVQRIQF